MLKRIIKYACIGFAIGAVVGNMIAVLTGLGQQDEILLTDQIMHLAGGSVTVGWLLQSLLSGLYGALCFGTMVFYDIERWPLALATAAHCLTIVLTFVPFALLLGWADSLAALLIMAGIQLAAYFIIWLILWSIYRKQVNELNEMQEHLQRSDKKQK